MIVTNSTLLINVLTGEYPVSLWRVRQDNPNVSFAVEPLVEVIRDLGYDVVTQTVRPDGDVVTEGAPSKIDGGYVQTWVIRPYTDEELAAVLATRKDQLSDQVDIARQATFQAGFEYDFGGAIGKLRVQVRDEDRINIVGLRVFAESSQVAAPDAEYDFRTASNVTVKLTAAGVIAMTNAAFARVQAIYTAAWNLKDEIATATTLAALPVVPPVLDV